jgi:DNA-binding transcriptional ArsR family regulator
MPQRPFRAIEPKAIDLARPAMFTGDRERQARRLVTTMCEPSRLAIVRALSRTPLAASDLALVVGRTRSATSQHLRVLREIEAVVPERRGNVIHYRLAETVAAQILADVAAAFDRLAA